MDLLNSQYIQLENQSQQLKSDIDRLGRQSAIRRQAIAEGLAQLPAPVVVAGR